MVEVLPPASITVVADIIQGCHTLELLPIPLPKPEIRFDVVANVWRHLLSFYVREIRFEVVELCVLTWSKIGWVIVAGTYGPPAPCVSTRGVVNL